MSDLFFIDSKTQAELNATDIGKLIAEMDSKINQAMAAQMRNVLANFEQSDAMHARLVHVVEAKDAAMQAVVGALATTMSEMQEVDHVAFLRDMQLFRRVVKLESAVQLMANKRHTVVDVFVDTGDALVDGIAAIVEDGINLGKRASKFISKPFGSKTVIS